MRPEIILLVEDDTDLREMFRTALRLKASTASDEDVSHFDVECVLRKPVTPDRLVQTVTRCFKPRVTARLSHGCDDGDYMEL